MDMLTLVVEASQPGMCVHVERVDGRGDIYYHGGCAMRSMLVRRMMGAEDGGISAYYVSKVSEYTVAVVPRALGRHCHICRQALDKVD